MGVSGLVCWMLVNMSLGRRAGEEGGGYSWICELWYIFDM